MAKPEERLPILVQHLRRLAGVVLGIPPERIDPEKPVVSLGLDSLMAVELRQRVLDETGLDLPLMATLQGDTLLGLAEHLLAHRERLRRETHSGHLPARARPGRRDASVTRDPDRVPDRSPHG